MVGLWKPHLALRRVLWLDLDLAPLRCHASCVEKRKPHHDLRAFKALFSTVTALTVTSAAMKDALALGYTRQKMVEAIQAMEPRHFYKSMTALADHTCWQDVYHVPHEGTLLYVKFTDDRITAFRVLSFKKR